MSDVLAGHADVVGDLVDVITLLSTGQDASAAQPVDGWVIGILGVNVLLIFADLSSDPFLPALADQLAFLRFGIPTAKPRADTVRRVGAAFR